MTTILVDGDLFAYRVAVTSQQITDFGGDQYTFSADAQSGKFNLEALLENFRERLGADDIVVAISDGQNFRKSVMPQYKSNRNDLMRPIILKVLLNHLKENYQTFIRPTLEADDVLGILATNPKVIKGDKIIVTMDKDLRSVPALHWNPEKEGRTPSQEPTFVSKKEADNNFYQQVLSGDATDGYKGCPHIGSTTAKKLVKSPIVVTPHEKEIKTGPNRGGKKIIWLSEPTSNVWDCIVSHYVKAGLTEEDALVNARVARILRHEDYNYKEKKPILWQPNR